MPLGNIIFHVWINIRYCQVPRKDNPVKVMSNCAIFAMIELFFISSVFCWRAIIKAKLHMDLFIFYSLSSLDLKNIIYLGLFVSHLTVHVDMDFGTRTDISSCEIKNEENAFLKHGHSTYHTVSDYRLCTLCSQDNITSYFIV